MAFISPKFCKCFGIRLPNQAFMLRNLHQFYARSSAATTAKKTPKTLQMTSFFNRRQLLFRQQFRPEPVSIAGDK